MELVYERCSGLDVHKKSVVACLSTPDAKGESTGVFWKPIYNLLEGHFELLVVNAQHMKAVPGRKVRHEVA